MSASGENVAPVIIKRKKVVGGDGHHGGAWKVAYADFVTAMMAFFLLMWLLNATTEQQRKGIADYFSPTIAINRISGGGDGAFGGDSVFSEEVLPQNGTGATQQRPTDAQKARGEMGSDADGANIKTADPDAERADEVQFAKIEEMLFGRGGESNVTRETMRHVITRVTDEGLVIELFDLENAQLFKADTDEPTDLLTQLVLLISAASKLVQNEIAVEGHTRAVPIVRAKNPVWDLSVARADQVRRMLEGEGIEAHRINRVTGHADKEPAVENPLAIRNNRLEVILLRTVPDG